MTDSTRDDEPNKKNWLSFWSLLILQGQNAFNDKAAQFLLIPMGAWLFLTQADIPGLGVMQYIEYVLAMVIVAPFILFSPLSGWISDRFSKTWVIRGASLLQLCVLLWITASVYYHQIWLAIAGFFLLSIQSVILSPAKKGIVKELLGSKKLGFASGLMEITAVLAICGGQIITGFWYSARLRSGMDGWEAALFPLLVFSAASVGTLVLSMFIQKVPSLNGKRFHRMVLFEHISQIKEVLKVREIRLSAAGAAFFWGFAGYLNLAAINIAKQLTAGGTDFAKVSAILMFAASLGIVFGGVFASLVSRKRIELGLIPIGGIVMVLGSVALAATPIHSQWLKMWFVLAGAGGAIMLVPVNANLQDLCPPEKRGKILAGLNLLDCLAGLLAAVVQMGLVYLKVPFSWQFVGLSVLCILVANYSARLLPQHFVRLLALGLFKVFYRIKPQNEHRVPEAGGVLLTPNHMSYVDAFILSAACPRKIRFLMFDEYVNRPFMGWFVKLFNTVPISQKRAKEAVRLAADALQEGDVVCIFPEGQLTRTGVMNEFKRGFEIIARRADCPVLPVVMDGLWGSIFSFERNRFFTKLPYRIPYGVTVNFGEPIPAKEATPQRLRRKLEALRAEAFASREVIQTPQKILKRRIHVLGDDPVGFQDAMRALSDLPKKEQSQIVANALQIGEVNALKRGDTVMIEWTSLGELRKVLGIVFPQYYKLKVVFLSSTATAKEVCALSKKYHVDHYICTTEHLASLWEENQLPGQCFYFSNGQLPEKGFPCLVSNGRVISMSMPHPKAQLAAHAPQEGHRQGAWGRLLPGFYVEEQDGVIKISGASTDGITLDPLLELDPTGMVILRSQPDLSHQVE